MMLETMRRSRLERGLVLASRLRLSACLLPLLLLATGVGAAAEPSALVEQVRPSLASAEPLDLLEPGQVIELPPGAELVLGYLASCERETIRGGRVVIGAERSRVTGGTVTRTPADCLGKPGAGAAPGKTMAGLTVRSLDVQSEADVAAPRAVPAASIGATELAARNPLLLLPEGCGVLEIAKEGDGGDALRAVKGAPRTPSEPAWRIAVAAPLVDLMAAGVTLEPGATYLLSFGQRSVRIRLGEGATITRAPPLTRLVRF